MTESRIRLLRELLDNRLVGMTADELADSLGVSRNAVQQQLTALERDDLVEVLELRSTGGRPSRAFTITETAMELFPRHYSKIAGALLRHTRDLFGEEGLERLLAEMADEATAELMPRLEGLSAEERVKEVVKILDELGYGAYLDEDGNVAAVNCVYHRLAQTTNAVCQYDTYVLQRLLGTGFNHTSCIRDGEPVCVFAPR